MGGQHHIRIASARLSDRRVGDFNGDGTSDVLWVNPTTNETDVWTLNNGHWAASTTIGSHPAGYQVVGVDDFNKDGTDDVVWYNPSNTTSTCGWSRMASGPAVRVSARIHRIGARGRR